MRTQQAPRMAPSWPRRYVDAVPQAAANVAETLAGPAPPDQPEGETPASAATANGPAAQPCPERIWWFGVLLGLPLMLVGVLLILSLLGAPLGIALWAAGTGLMLSPRPCRD